MYQSNTRQILLGSRQGIQRFAIVDAEDYETLNVLRWYCANGYAVRNPDIQPGKTIRMHRVIMDAPDGMDVDHINGNRLDNRRCNLRLCTEQQNGMNRKLICTRNKSGYKGVSWSRSKSAWIAQLEVQQNGKRKCFYLGQFDDPVEASEAYKAAALRIHGEFARPS